MTRAGGSTPLAAELADLGREVAGHQVDTGDPRADAAVDDLAAQASALLLALAEELGAGVDEPGGPGRAARPAHRGPRLRSRSLDGFRPRDDGSRP